MGQKHSSGNRKNANDQLQEVTEAVRYAADKLDGEDLSSKVELSISCPGLTGHIHARVSIWIKRSISDSWFFVGETEDVSSSSMLEFVRSTLIDFSFEIQTNIRFELYRVAAIGEDSLLCVAECYLAQLLAVNGGTSSLDMFVPDEADRPSLIPCLLVPRMDVFAEESAHSLNSMSFDISVQIFAKRSFWKPSYYMTLGRTKLANDIDASKESVLVYRSTCVKPNFEKDCVDTGFIVWKDIEVNTEKLCRGAPWRPIELCVFTKKGKLVGHTLLAAVDFEQCSRCFRPSRLFYNLLSPTNTLSGKIAVQVNQVTQQYSFLDYVVAGLEICVMVGIDFTRSNGDPRVPESLHAFVPSSSITPDGDMRTVFIPGPRNDYALVLRSVLEILQQYDSDKQIPVYGFGAKLPPSHTITSHCFALSGDFFHPEVAGIEGVFRAYQEALGAVTMHGPTRICDILKLAGQYAQPLLGTAKYCILLLITDGVIEDFQASVDEIVLLANLPLSIVIVGVGEEDFSLMKILDADDHALVSSVTGATMHRDIVQFVPFSEYKDASYSELARATLEEIPREVINYFAQLKVYPQINPAEHAQRRLRKYVGFSGLEGVPRPNTFLATENAALVKSVTCQGYDGKIVNRVINETGILSLDPMHLLDVMFYLHKHKVVKPYGPNLHRSIADRLGVPDFLAPELELTTKKMTATETKPCGVCYTNPIDIELHSCGHRVICSACFEQMPPICPLCRAVVNGMIQIS